MKAPVLNEQCFDRYKSIICNNHVTIGKLNGKGCRKNFTLKVPEIPEGFNSHLVIHNHRGRWFYAPMSVEVVTGSKLRIISNPMVIWAGYVIYQGTIYRVSADDVRTGILTHVMIIPIEEVES